jgi:hypothetical protein
VTVYEISAAGERPLARSNTAARRVKAKCEGNVVA